MEEHALFAPIRLPAAYYVYQMTLWTDTKLRSTFVLCEISTVF